MSSTGRLRIAAKFSDIVASARADVLLSNHTKYDMTFPKLAALKARKAGAPHPFVIGTDAVRRSLTVANECAQAGVVSK
jgi:hypothetical protein